jgi:chemotaxis protein methyltransferase CheR
VKFNSSLLSNVVFSDHSLSTDSVFSEIHFISCRNVLIYFNSDLQNRVFKLFEDSLVRSGFLGLGSKETISFSDSKRHFISLDSENRIYQKLAGPA